MKGILFNIKGGFNIPDIITADHSFDGSTIVSFNLPDGRCARLCMALEVLSEEGQFERVVSSDKDLEAVGFSDLDYEFIEASENEHTD